MSARDLLRRSIARALRATVLVDRGFALFDRLRSRAVVALGNDRFYAAYNDVTYSDQDRYRPDRAAFKPELYDWERKAIRRTFPPPPARILIGGAGGGREALALARLGYSIVAFDRAAALVEVMTRAIPPEARIEPLHGGYEDLPRLRRADGTTVDLSGETFDAAILGWSSFSHVPVALRVSVLERMAVLTCGPILLSFLPRVAESRGLDGATFSVHVGFYRALAMEEVLAVGRLAGLDEVPLGDARESAVVVLRRASRA